MWRNPVSLPPRLSFTFPHLALTLSYSIRIPAHSLYTGSRSLRIYCDQYKLPSIGVLPETCVYQFELRSLATDRFTRSTYTHTHSHTHSHPHCIKTRLRVHAYVSLVGIVPTVRSDGNIYINNRLRLNSSESESTHTYTRIYTHAHA